MRQLFEWWYFENGWLVALPFIAVGMIVLVVMRIKRRRP